MLANLHAIYNNWKNNTLSTWTIAHRGKANLNISLGFELSDFVLTGMDSKMHTSIILVDFQKALIIL